MSGAGTQVLAGANTYNGGTTVSGGTLRLGNAAALGGNNAGLLTVNGGVLDLAGYSPTASAGLSLTLAGGSIVNSGTSAALSATAFNVQSGSISASLAGGAALTKTTSGMATLSGSNTYGGGTTISAGTLALGAAGTLGSGNLTIAPGAVWDVSAYGSSGYTFGGGVLTAGRTASFATDINGTLNVNNATINVAGAGNVGTLTISGSLALSSGTLAYVSGDQIALTGGGALTLAGTDYVTPNVQLSSGTYTLFTGSSVPLNPSSYLFTNGVFGSNPRQTYVFGSSGGTAVTLTVGGQAGNLLWRGGTWDNQVSTSWYNTTTSSANLFYLGDNVTFDDSAGTANGNATITGGTSGTVLPATLVVSNTAVSYVFSGSGSISGITSLVKNGPGSLTINNSNAYSGGTLLNAGTLVLGNNSALGGGPLTIAAGAALDANAAGVALAGNPQNWNGNFTFNGSNSLNLGSGSVAMAGNTQITVNANALTVGGAISGTGGLTLAGSGALVLGGSSTYGGGTTVTGGTLQFGTANALLSSGAVTVNGPAAVLDLGTFNSAVGAVTLANGTIQNGTLTGTSYSLQNGLVSANLAGIGAALSKNTSGLVVLGGSNTYTGATTVNGGTLQLGVANALPANTALTLSNTAATVLDLNGNNQTVGSLAGGAGGGNVALGGGVLTVGGAPGMSGSASTVYLGGISGSGGLTKQGAGMLTLGASQGYAGPTIVSGGTLQLGLVSGLAHRWSFNGSLADSVGGSTATLFGTASLGANQVTLPGGTNGTSYVSLGSNLLPTTNSPATIALWATESQVQTWSRIFDFGSTAGGVSNLMWSWTQGTSNPGAIWAGAGSNQNAYAYTNTGTENHIALVLTPNGSSTNLNWYQFSASGTVLNQGSYTSSWNISQLTQSNMWLGHSEYSADHDASASYNEVRIWDTALTQAQLSMFSSLGPDSLGASSNVLPVATPLSIAANATLDLAGMSQQVASLADLSPGSGGSVVSSNAALATVLTLSPTGGSTTFSGVVAGGGGLGAISLAMSGAGTQVLAGSNTYTGGTTISAGTLQLGAANALPTATALSFANAAGAVLNLNGNNQTVGSLAGGGPSGGNVTLGGGVLTVGGAPGTSGSAGTVYSGVIGGAGGLIKQGAGQLTLSAVQSYSGPTTISGGTLQLGVANALPTATALSFANSAGAVLNLNGNNQTVGSLAGGGASGGNVTLGGGSLTVGNAGNTTYSGAVSGAGALVMQGTGMLTLTNPQGYSGPTIVSAGTLQLQAQLSAAPLAYTFANGTAANIGSQSVTTTTSGNPTFSASGGPAPGLGYVTLNGSQYIEIDPTSGNLPNLGGASGNSYTIGMWIKTSTPGGEFLYKGSNVTTLWPTGCEAFFLTSGVGAGAGGTGTHVGGVQSSGGWVGGNTSVVNGNWNYISIVRNGGTSTLYVNGVADGTSTGMNVAEQGTQMIRIGWTNDGPGSNPNDGPVNFNGSISGVAVYGSALTAAQIQSLIQGGNILPIATPLTVAANATLDLGGANQQVASLSDQSAGSGGSVINSNPSLAALLTLSPAPGSTTFSGQIQGGGGLGTLSLMMSGNGTQVLAGSNTYTGGTTVSGGMLQLGSQQGVPDNTALTVSGGTLDLGTFTKTTTAAVSFQGGVTQNGDIVNNGTAYDGQAGMVSASLQGAAGLNKSTGGTLILSGTNVLGGAVNANAGILQIDGSLMTHHLNVNNDARLAGVGTLSTTGDSLYYGSTAASTFAGTIAGNQAIEVFNGTLVLAGSNTNTGGVSVYSNGATTTTPVLRMGATSALLYGSTAGNLSVAGSGVFDLAGFTTNVNGLTGNGTVDNTAAPATLVVGNNDAISTFAGVIQNTTGPLALYKTGSGTFTLGGSSTYVGGTTMNNGMLVVADGPNTSTVSSALGTGVLTLNGGTLAAGPAGGSVAGLVQAGNAAHIIAPGAALASGFGTLNLNGGLSTNANTTLALNVNLSRSSSTGNGNGEPVYIGDMIYLGGNGLSGSGNFSFNGANLGIGDYRLIGGTLGSNLNTNNFALSGYSAPTNDTVALSTTADSGYLDLVVAANAATFSGSATWAGTSGSSVWSNSGNWNDNSNGTIHGVPGISLSRTADTATFNGTDSAPTITLDVNPSLAALSFSGTNYTLTGSGVLTMNGGTAGSTITVAGGTQSIASTVQIAGGNLVVAASGNGLLALSGSVADDGGRSLTLTGDGSGQLVLGGANSYGGGTYVEQGTLVANDNGAIPDSSGLIVGAGGTFIFDPTVTGVALDATSLHPASQINPVPEPGTLALLAVAGMAAAAVAWRKRRT